MTVANSVTLGTAPSDSRPRSPQRARQLWTHPTTVMIARRVGLMIPTAFLSSVMTFILVHLVPGGPAQARLGVTATPEGIEAVNQQLGLNHSLVDQYWRWLTGIFQGNLGVSLQTGEPVSTMVGQDLPVTIELVILAALICLAWAVPAGVVAARRAGSRTDGVIRTTSGLGLAVPDFFLAIVLIDIFAVGAGLFPELGFVPLSENFGQNLYHLVLPAAAMGLGAGGIVARQVRSAMLDQLTGDYVRTARAMGIPERTIVWRYATRNAMPTILNAYGLVIVGMLGATIIIEQVFVLPGLGNALVNAIEQRDYTFLQGAVLVYVVIVLLVNLVVDVIVQITAGRTDGVG
ncbi:MAG TPA: ABC transporter permease [Trebonia sp.]|jgi:peptide/nickel transport system permease protein